MARRKPPPGRSPKATNIEMFYDSALASRDPGQWPAALRQAWEAHQNPVEPLPLGPDNMESKGARASQYSS